MKPREQEMKQQLIRRREFSKQLLFGGITALAGATLLTQLSCGMGEQSMDPKPLRGVVRDKLMERIKFDDPTNFKDDKHWDKVRLGIYYDDDDELINIVVYEIAADLSVKHKNEARYLPDDVWRTLINRVGPNNTAEEAVEPIFDAVTRAVPLPPGNEGKYINGPRKQPTLRSARKPK